MKLDTLCANYSVVYRKNFSLRSFERDVGYSPEVVLYVYNKTEFWRCGCIGELFYVLTFIKNGSSSANAIFYISKSHYDLRMWKAAYYLRENLREITIENYESSNDFDSFPSCRCIVDTTPFKVPRQRNFEQSKVLFSPNYGIYCYKYQIVVNRENGLICSIMGPYNGSVDDSTILCASGIFSLFPGDVGFFADKIYYKPSMEEFQRVFIGYRQPFKNQMEEEFSRSFSRERVLVENVISRLKAYKGYSERVWRYGPDKHQAIVWIAANLVNIEISLGSPL